jgi:hypothetical protein
LNIWHPGLPGELLQPDRSDIIHRIIAAEMEKFIWEMGAISSA